MNARPLLFALLLIAATLSASCGPPENPWVKSAEEHAAAGDLDSAVAFYELALDEEGARDDPAISMRLAALLERSGHERLSAGDPEIALERFNRARELYGEPAPDTLLAGVVGAERALELSPEARLPALRALAERLESPELLLELAITYERLRDDIGARDTLARLDAIGAAEPRQLLQLARLQEVTGELASSVETYERYLALEPDSALARASLARVYEEQGANAKAEALLRANTDARPDSLRAWRALYAFYQRREDAEGLAAARARIEALTQPDERPRMKPLR